jgi:hypothetical protein
VAAAVSSDSTKARDNHDGQFCSTCDGNSGNDASSRIRVETTESASRGVCDAVAVVTMCSAGVSMKTSYKGHEIVVERSESMMGDEMLFYSIFRESDGFECESNFSSGSETKEEFTELLKERVDAELSEADPWGEKETLAAWS